MWVFGYGSLIWKVDFPYEQKFVGYIKGYIRRFHQRSTDHRGVPSRPGRVVTLLASENPDDKVWGVAYKISSENIDNVVNHLDFREKGGYERKTILFYPCYTHNNISTKSLSNENSTSNLFAATSATDLSSVDELPFHLTIYIGGEDNPNYAGVEDIDSIAKQIFISHGPSGSNVEYLDKLASAMRTIAPGIHDEHLFALEAAVKKLEEEAGKEH